VVFRVVLCTSHVLSTDVVELILFIQTENITKSTFHCGIGLNYYSLLEMSVITIIIAFIIIIIIINIKNPTRIRVMNYKGENVYRHDTVGLGNNCGQTDAIFCVFLYNSNG